MKLLKSHQCFEGLTQFWEHASSCTQSPMKFSVHLPPGEIKGALIWLSGLTCTEENFIMKAGSQRFLSKIGLMIICPDTSPRNLHLPGELENTTFGEGAGLYLNASTPFYRDHYRLYDYIHVEIYELLLNHFGVKAGTISIMGHSMGGHGALVIGLRESQKFQSISVLAPVSNPTNTPWCKKSFIGYLGEDRNSWNDFDACELIKKGFRHPYPILIDQGSEDPFALELLTESFIATCQKEGQELDVHWRKGYDHSYYYVSTFIEFHISFHSKAMKLI